MNIIINNQNIITNKQIEKILKLTRFTKLDNLVLMMLEKRKDILQVKAKDNPLCYTHFIYTFINKEGLYDPVHDFITINLFNINGNIEDKKLYGIGVLLHELKHRDDLMIIGDSSEDSADKYTIKFLNNNSRVIKDILKLKDEWEIEDF